MDEKMSPTNSLLSQILEVSKESLAVQQEQLAVLKKIAAGSGGGGESTYTVTVKQIDTKRKS